MKRRVLLQFILLAFVTGAIATPSTAFAKDYDDDDDLDEEDAAESVRKGRIIPLKEALYLLAERYKGRVIDVKLSREHGQYIYEFTVRDSGGRVREVEMDGRTGRIGHED